jgi:hypothetical protein
VQIVLNTYLFKGQSFEKVKPKIIQFTAMTMEGDASKLTLFTVKLKEEDVANTLEKLKKHVPA